MALRARQEQQLHLAIALYLESKFPETHKAFEREAHIDVSTPSSDPFSGSPKGLGFMFYEKGLLAHNSLRLL